MTKKGLTLFLALALVLLAMPRPTLGKVRVSSEQQAQIRYDVSDAYSAIVELNHILEVRQFIWPDEWRQLRTRIGRGIQAIGRPLFRDPETGRALSIETKLNEALLSADLETAILYPQEAVTDWQLDVAQRLAQLTPERKAMVIAEAHRIGTIGLSTELDIQMRQIDQLLTSGSTDDQVIFGSSINSPDVFRCLLHLGLGIGVALAVAACAAATGGIGLAACIAGILSLPLETMELIVACFGR